MPAGATARIADDAAYGPAHEFLGTSVLANRRTDLRQTDSRRNAMVTAERSSRSSRPMDTFAGIVIRILQRKTVRRLTGRNSNSGSITDDVRGPSLGSALSLLLLTWTHVSEQA
jgi:hypothetical protein